MSEHLPHALVVKTHWESNAKRLREQLQTSQQEAEKQATETRDAFAIRAGIEAYVARAALGLVDEILAAAKAAEDNLPIRMQHGQFLLLDGKVKKVLDASAEDDVDEDGRQRWEVVTDDKLGQRWGAEKAEGQPSGADATAPSCTYRGCGKPPEDAVHMTPTSLTEGHLYQDTVSAGTCLKCLKAFDETDTSFEGRAQQGGTPFCRECVTRCHDTEIADHWCKIDEWRSEVWKP